MKSVDFMIQRINSTTSTTMIPETFFLAEISGPREGINLPRSWNPGS